MTNFFKSGYSLFLRRPLDRARTRDLFSSTLMFYKNQLVDLVRMTNFFKSGSTFGCSSAPWHLRAWLLETTWRSATLHQLSCHQTTHKILDAANDIAHIHSSIDPSTHLTFIMAQPPDLQAILATLAQYTQQQSASSATPPPAPQPTATLSSFATIPATEDNSQAASHNASIEAAPADPRLRGRPQSRSTTPFQAQNVQPQHVQPQAPSVIDPATITVWQDGLRCVTKIASQNKMFEASIRKVSRFRCVSNRSMNPLTFAYRR